VVATAAHRHRHALGASEANRVDHVGDALTLDDERGLLGHGAIPDLSRLVIAGVAGLKGTAAKARSELLQMLVIHEETSNGKSA
jgi:hypothetical protein